MRAMEDICPAKDRNANVFVRVLHEACRTLGGVHNLAEYLGVSVVLVEFWLDGRGQPPDAIFLRCSDLLHQQS
jgi:hypothetical protein